MKCYDSYQASRFASALLTSEPIKGASAECRVRDDKGPRLFRKIREYAMNPRI